MRSLLVVFPIAESTTTGRSSGKLRMRSATSRIRSAEATDDPPNFITTVSSGAAPPPSLLSCAASTTEASFLSTMAAPTARWHRTAAFLRHGAAGTATGAKAPRRLAAVAPSSASPSRAVVRRAGAAMPVPRGWSGGGGEAGGAAEGGAGREERTAESSARWFLRTGQINHRYMSVHVWTRRFLIRN